MVKQPEKGARDVNIEFYEAEGKRINLLNQEFFKDVELTDRENRVLVWLCGWDEDTVRYIASAFLKARA